MGENLEPSAQIKLPVDSEKQKGLAILPVIPTVLPTLLLKKSAEIRSLDHHYSGIELKAHWYALRTIQDGFLYILKLDWTWDVFVVNPAGMLNLDEPPKKSNGNSSNLPTAQRSIDATQNILVIDPAKHASVWIAFSHFRWTKKVQDDYVKNKEGCRDKRMLKLDVMAAAAGSLGPASKSHNAVKAGFAMSAEIGQMAADFASAGARKEMNEYLEYPLRPLSDSAPSLARRMAVISRETQGKTGAVIVLPDHLGLTIEANVQRHKEMGRLTQYIAEWRQRMAIGDIILNLEKSFKDNGQSAEWESDYKDGINYDQIPKDKKEYEDYVTEKDRLIDSWSDDVAILNESPQLTVWWHDFDPDDHQSAKDRQNATARCVFGAVKTKREQGLWERWLKEEPNNPYATFWGAVTALSKDFGDYLKTIEEASSAKKDGDGNIFPDMGQADKLNEMAKQAMDPELPRLRDLIKNGVQRFRGLLKSRTSDAAMTMIGQTLVSQVGRLQSNVSAFATLGWRIKVMISVRTDITLAATYIKVTQSQLKLMFAEATFGRFSPLLERLYYFERARSGRIFVVDTHGEVIPAPVKSVEQTILLEVWIPESELAAAPKVLALPGTLSRLAIPPPQRNFFKGLVDFTKDKAGKFAWVGLMLSVFSFGNALNKFLTTQKDEDHKAEFMSLLSSGLGLVGALADIAGSILKKMIQGTIREGSRRVLANVLVGVGGILVAGATLVEILKLLREANDLDDAGDHDAATWKRYAVIPLACAGAGFFVVGVAALFGVTVPIVGWVILLGLGIYLLFMWIAGRKTDNPLQHWLKLSYYGNAKKKWGSLEVELAELNKVIYTTEIKVDWSDGFWAWNSAIGDWLEFSLRLPGIGKETVLACQIRLIEDGRQDLIFDEVIRPWLGPGIQADPRALQAGPDFDWASFERDSYIWEKRPAVRNGDEGAAYDGRLFLKDSKYDSAEVIIQYWPNAVDMPNLVVPLEPSARVQSISD